MKSQKSADKLNEILSRDKRYSASAYALVSEAMSALIGDMSGKRHVDGAELFDSVVTVARNRYGNMGRLVLESWGIYNCEDIGEVVFNMVDAGILARRPSDSRSDFKGAPNFTVLFDRAEVIL